MHVRSLRNAYAPAALLVLATACGGGSGSGNSGTAVGSRPSSAAPGSGTASSLTATTTGAISAFGSVFVDKTEYSTAGASLVDDDTGAVGGSLSALEAGQVVDLRYAPGSTTASTSTASELHVHPLVRGYADVVGTSTIAVMGQTVALGAATAVSDHRACVTASSNPCTAVTAVTGLTATQGSGSTAVAGSYVVVDGYLYGASASAGSATVVATLVSVHDAPTSAGAAAFKVEGPVTAASGSTVTIGNLAIDLTGATCRVQGATTPCAGAFATGTVVSAFSATAPALPATTFAATGARAVPTLAVQTAGAAAGLEGRVSSVGTTSFVIGGVTVDASALAASALPAVGDIVDVTGTIGTGGTTIVASAVSILHAASSRSYGFEGDATGVVAGSAANTFTLTVLGESITVDATTRLADRSSRTWGRTDPATNPFNISTFQSYLAASASQHLVVQTATDASGHQIARSVTIAPASTVASVQGPVDASPAVVNSGTTGTPTTFGVAGIAVSADPAAIASGGAASLGSVAAGDQVLVRGSFAAGILSVGATRSASNRVTDFGSAGSGRGSAPCF